jgi:hypothetical protein
VRLDATNGRIAKMMHLNGPAQDICGKRIVVVLLLFGSIALGRHGLLAADNTAKGKSKKLPYQTQGSVAPTASRAALLKHQDWQDAPTSPLQPGEIDRLVATGLEEKIATAPLTTDEEFLRRVSLDLTGQLPVPADVEEFVKNSDPRKRAKLIDKLLDSEEYARHWARYWRDVISSRITDRRGMLLAGTFEDWLSEQFRTNQSWGKIVHAMICAEGACRFDDGGKNGAAFFLASHLGQDAANEQASETARIFLGIQLQCAQCHDHPSDQWKRVQFHELAGYFSRVRERPIRGDGRPAGVELISLPRGEHEMPDKADPAKMLVTPPRFLDGTGPNRNASDKERRRSLANALVNKKNYWFAAAYVNRIWGDLMGQSFYQPVDDLGPHKEAVFPRLLTRLSAAFQGSDYDIKKLFRAILNSQTYQRQIRLGESADRHLHFAAAYPTRLPADTLWDSLETVLGSLSGPAQPVRPLPAGPFAFRSGLEGAFKLEFSFDPSTKADEVEGSIPQALLMMNNPAINQRIQAKGSNLLARILTAFPADDDALLMVYLKTLARRPTDSELKKCREYLKKANSRNEGFEDIVWALLNSTEFQTKR